MLWARVVLTAAPSPRYTLLDNGGVFRHVTVPQSSQYCEDHRFVFHILYVRDLLKNCRERLRVRSVDPSMPRQHPRKALQLAPKEHYGGGQTGSFGPSGLTICWLQLKHPQNLQSLTFKLVRLEDLPSSHEGVTSLCLSPLAPGLSTTN